MTITPSPPTHTHTDHYCETLWDLDRFYFKTPVYCFSLHQSSTASISPYTTDSDVPLRFQFPLLHHSIVSGCPPTLPTSLHTPKFRFLHLSTCTGAFSPYSKIPLSVSVHLPASNILSLDADSIVRICPSNFNQARCSRHGGVLSHPTSRDPLTLESMLWQGRGGSGTARERPRETGRVRESPGESERVREGPPQSCYGLPARPVARLSLLVIAFFTVRPAWVHNSDKSLLLIAQPNNARAYRTRPVSL